MCEQIQLVNELVEQIKNGECELDRIGCMMILNTFDLLLQTQEVEGGVSKEDFLKLLGEVFSTKLETETSFTYDPETHTVNVRTVIKQPIEYITMTVDIS